MFNIKGLWKTESYITQATVHSTKTSHPSFLIISGNILFHKYTIAATLAKFVPNCKSPTPRHLILLRSLRFVSVTSSYSRCLVLKMWSFMVIASFWNLLVEAYFELRFNIKCAEIAMQIELRVQVLSQLKFASAYCGFCTIWTSKCYSKFTKWCWTLKIQCSSRSVWIFCSSTMVSQTFALTSFQYPILIASLTTFRILFIEFWDKWATISKFIQINKNAGFAIFSFQIAVYLCFRRKILQKRSQLEMHRGVRGMFRK